MDGGIKIKKLTVLLAAFLILALISGIGAAAEIIVSPGSSIQTAVNNSSSGDVIIIKPGTYIENINITKSNITIQSESGNPANTIIKAKNSGANVFFIQANNVKISGLQIVGATRSGYSGICLSSCNNCTIENNKLLNNSYGIYVLNSKGDKLSENTAINNGQYGILLGTAIYNILSGNTVSDNKAQGIHIGNSDSNTLSGNTIRNNIIYGLFVCPRSDKNLIYNNYVNDTNISIRNGIGNAYNITKTSGTNIIGGPYIGGNFWGKPDGTGFSDTAVDRDGDGISDSPYKNITGSVYSDYLPLVANKSGTVAPVAAFSASPTTGNAPLNVTFTDNSTGSPTAWKWNFGDGTNSTTKNPVHNYSKTGNYTVALTVSNAAGNNTTTKTNYIKVTAATIKPIANFTSNVTSGKIPLNVAFMDKSTGAPKAWKWAFGDGTNSTTQNPTHNYSKAGNYTVALTVSNAAGNNTTTKTNYIKVTATTIKPVANFTSDVTSGKVPLNVSFTDKSTGSPTSWKWTFGDGTNSTIQNPKHTYSKAGNYTVALTVSSAASNNTTTKTNYIKVTANNSQNATIPVVSFWGSRTSGTAPITIGFTDASTNTPTAWNWSFGDGTYSTVQNPRHTYSKAGNYSVTLSASNAAGTGTKTRANYIKIT